MIVAMMLPTAIPLLVTFGALVRRRRSPGVLVALAVVGYVVTWTAFGLVAWIGDRGVHAAVDAIRGCPRTRSTSSRPRSWSPGCTSSAR